MTEATVRANGIEIFYQLGGEGPPLLFCNGSGSTLESAALVTAAIGEGFTLLAHDQRGLGKTEIPPGPYSMADYAADALALLDAVGWDTCRLVGMSFGGMVALELAVTAPERFERIALLCTSPGGEGGASFPLHELDGLADDERVARYLSVLDTRFDDAWLEAHPGDQMIVDVLRKGQTIEKSAERLRGEREQLEARRHHDVHDRLGAITAPTFVAAGRYDGVAPLPNSEAIVAGIPNAELHVYEGGHVFPFQDRTALPEIRAFLLG
jgi:3-oxoadipate enol-lactonase